MNRIYYIVLVEEEKGVGCIFLDWEADWDGIDSFSKTNVRILRKYSGRHCINETVKLCTREYAGAIFLFQTTL